MKLDNRIIEGKKPLTAFDEMESKFIGTGCYFSDNASDYGDLSNCQIGCLSSRDGKTGVFNAMKNNSYAFFIYCLPCEWVKPEEPKKKYRPYSIAEFLKLYQVGDIVEFRAKICDEFYRVMFIGYITNSNRSMDEKPGESDVMLGNYLYSLSHLFEDYELFFEDEWQPFGKEGFSE